MNTSSLAPRWLAALLIFSFVGTLGPTPAYALRAGLEQKTKRELQAALIPAPAGLATNLPSHRSARAQQLARTRKSRSSLQSVTDPETGVGMIYTRDLLEDTHLIIQGNEDPYLIRFISRYPAFARKVGMVHDHSAHVLRYPDGQALNARVAKLRGTPDEIFVSFVNVQGEVNPMTYARYWAQGQAALAEAPSELFWHDHGSHLPAFLTFPPELVEASRGEMAFLIALADDASLMSNARFKTRVDELIKDMVSHVEDISSEWAASLIEGKSGLIHLYGSTEIRRGSASSLGKVLSQEFSSQMTFEQRGRLAALARTASRASVTPKRIRTLYAKTYERLVSKESAGLEEIPVTVMGSEEPAPTIPPITAATDPRSRAREILVLETPLTLYYTPEGIGGQLASRVAEAQRHPEFNVDVRPQLLGAETVPEPYAIVVKSSETVLANAWWREAYHIAVVNLTDQMTLAQILQEALAQWGHPVDQVLGVQRLDDGRLAIYV